MHIHENGRPQVAVHESTHIHFNETKLLGFGYGQPVCVFVLGWVGGSEGGVIKFCCYRIKQYSYFRQEKRQVGGG